MTTLLDPPAPSPRAPEPAPSRASVRAGRFVTGLLMISPPIALAIAIPLLWGHAISLLDIVLAAIFYVVTGLGIAVGYHRLFTHRSFRSVRWLKILLASTGFDGRRGFRRRLGRDPPSPSRLQRQARRSALAARVRARARRAAPRLRARARRVVVQDRPDLGASATRPTSSPTPTR